MNKSESTPHAHTHLPKGVPGLDGKSGGHWEYVRGLGPKLPHCRYVLSLGITTELQTTEICPPGEYGCSGQWTLWHYVLLRQPPLRKPHLLQALKSPGYFSAHNWACARGMPMKIRHSPRRNTPAQDEGKQTKGRAFQLTFPANNSLLSVISTETSWTCSLV